MELKISCFHSNFQQNIDPWPQVILWVCLGMFATLVVLAVVAVSRVILNRSKVERVRENLENIIHSGQRHENHCQLIQPMLGRITDGVSVAGLEQLEHIKLI